MLSQTSESIIKHSLISLIALCGLILTAGTSTTFSVFVGVMVLLQIGIFLSYDSIVQKSSTRSKNLINDHFPSDIQDKLLSGESVYTQHSEVTVVFADLVGFTSWSSGRNPMDTFVVLEKLYGEFDVLAKKHHMFKIETVGDCYLCMAGAPYQDANHALHAAEFSQAMVTAAQKVFDSLNSNLQTNNLDVRVGMHTGPIVAGVLKGTKRRYQIFGDTVNTAARCESLGAPSRIQVSKATADALKAVGKWGWLRKRSEPINAKGKGFMTTYWLNSKYETDQPTSQADILNASILRTLEESMLQYDYTATPNNTKQPAMRSSRSQLGGQIHLRSRNLGLSTASRSRIVGHCFA